VGIGVVVVAAALFYYLPDYLPVPPLSYYLPVRTAPPSTQSAPPVVYSPADIARGKCQSEAARSGDTPGTTDRLSRCLEAADALYK
jgi:hypothetical protein